MIFLSVVYLQFLLHLHYFTSTVEHQTAHDVGKRKVIIGKTPVYFVFPKWSHQNFSKQCRVSGRDKLTGPLMWLS